MFQVRQSTNFSLKRKALASSYSTIKDVKNYYRPTGQNKNDLLDLSRITEGSQIDKYFRSPGSNNKDCSILSNTLYDTNNIYSQLLNYLSNIYYWRYTVTPRKVKSKGKTSIEEYKKIYNNMLEVVEGSSIETVFPALLLQIFKKGKVFICTSNNKASKAISTIILPEEYCKTTFTNQFNTQEIMFDFNFFGNLGLSTEEIDDLLLSFPEEMQYQYTSYVNGEAPRWQSLNGRFATCISMNEEGFPTFLSIMYDLIDYKTYKMNELDRNTNLLERIVAQEIDMESTGLDMEEIQGLHDSMADIVCANRGSTLITSPGKLAVHQLQENMSQENTVLANSYKSIYDNAGFNNALFTGDGEPALETSLKRDLSFVWGFVQKLEAFYNLSINNHYNFKDYQLSLKILPLSPYNEKEKLEVLHQAATLGVGVIDYVVATGVKQVDLESTIELEEFLQLTDRLRPLQSSHTQSSTVGESEQEASQEDITKKDVSTEPSKTEDNLPVDEKDSTEDEEKE